LIVFEEIIEYNDFINLLAVWVIALLHMFFHFLDDPRALLLDEVDVLLLVDVILVPLEFVLDLLHRVGGEDSKLFVDLLLD
jgi:hypothetical protein